MGNILLIEQYYDLFYISVKLVQYEKNAKVTQLEISLYGHQAKKNVLSQYFQFQAIIISHRSLLTLILMDVRLGM